MNKIACVCVVTYKNSTSLYQSRIGFSLDNSVYYKQLIKKWDEEKTLRILTRYISLVDKHFGKFKVVKFYEIPLDSGIYYL